jgi:hypothetical protein
MQQGIRERFYQEVSAQGLPFDNGKFALVEESIHVPLPEDDPHRFSASRMQWPEGWQRENPYELVTV